jgi:hypothetical protein
MTKGRILWDCALVLAGVLYMAMVLFTGIESALFAMVFVTLAGFEVIHFHRRM